MRRSLSLLTAALLTATPALGQVEFLTETFAYDQNQPAAGHWVGSINSPNGPEMFAAVLTERDEAGAWSATTTFLAAGAISKPCRDVTVDNRSLSFALPGVGGEVRFKGVISDDGQRFRGSATPVGPGGVQQEPASFEFARAPRPTDLPEPMAFSGKIEIQAMPVVEMTVVIAETPGGNLVGHVDVPAQFLKAYPLTNIHRTGGTITATLPVPAPATFEVTLTEDKQNLRGRFMQGPFDVEIDFARDEEYAYRDVPRPQHPKPPYPYDLREVVVDHPDGFVLAGTLTVPPKAQFGSGPFPTAVLISGSGQQDRDETILGHKPFLVIADYLTRHGIAVMRYDDRGVGASSGAETLKSATSADFATDALAVFNHLQTLDIVDSKRIGLIGHSEGGMIAPMVAPMTDPDEAGVAFMVLLAGTAVPGRDLLPLQMELGLKAIGGAPEHVEAFRTQFTEAIDLILANGDEEAIRANFKAAAESMMRATGVEPEPEMVEQFLAAQQAALANPWMRYFMEYDPAPALLQIHCPVLALNGTMDLQVWHEQNLNVIEKTITEAGGDVTARRYEGLNHLFQRATTGSVAEYAAIETTFDEAVLSDIVEWIQQKVTDS